MFICFLCMLRVVQVEASVMGQSFILGSAAELMCFIVCNQVQL